MTDLATTPRRKLSTRDRLAVFERAGGICVLCSRKIAAGERWIAEHIRALGLGGEDAPDNMAPAHEACARAKTNGRDGDLARIAKAKRVKAKHIGAHRSARPMPGSRASGWRKRMDGRVERR